MQLKFGRFSQIKHTIRGIHDGEIPHNRQLQNAISVSCEFARGSSLLSVTEFVYYRFDAAADGFERAIKAGKDRAPYYTHISQQGPVRIAEGKDRSMAYLNTSVIALRWTPDHKESSALIAGVHQFPLTSISVKTLCPKGATRCYVR